MVASTAKIQDGDAALEQDHEGVEAGQQQEADLRGIGRREIDGAVPVLDPVQEHHQRPEPGRRATDWRRSCWRRRNARTAIAGLRGRPCRRSRGRPRIPAARSPGQRRPGSGLSAMCCSAVSAPHDSREARRQDGAAEGGPHRGSDSAASPWRARRERERRPPGRGRPGLESVSRERFSATSQGPPARLPPEGAFDRAGRGLFPPRVSPERRCGARRWRHGRGRAPGPGPARRFRWAR